MSFYFSLFKVEDFAISQQLEIVGIYHAPSHLEHTDTKSSDSQKSVPLPPIAKSIASKVAENAKKPTDVCAIVFDNALLRITLSRPPLICYRIGTSSSSSWNMLDSVSFSLDPSEDQPAVPETLSMFISHDTGTFKAFGDD